MRNFPAILFLLAACTADPLPDRAQFLDQQLDATTADVLVDSAVDAETDLTAAETDLQPAETSLTDAETDLQTAETDLQGEETDLQGAETGQKDAETDLQPAETTVKDAETDVAAAETDAADAEGDVAGAVAEVSDPCAGGKICDDGNACTDDSCASASGCVFAPKNGAGCSDGNACTLGDTCSGSSCTSGGPNPCDDNSPCTGTGCAPSIGCTYANIDNVPCSDGNACTTGDFCVDTICNSGGPTGCDDGNPCTLDGCNTNSGCTHTPSGSATTCYLDSDGDGYGSASTSQVSCGVCPSGYVTNKTDCYDGSADAKPGQTKLFSVNRGDGSFDYDCDGIVTKAYNDSTYAVCSSANVCVFPGDCSLQKPFSWSDIGCGVTLSFPTACVCLASTCESANSDSRTQTCR